VVGLVSGTRVSDDYRLAPLDVIDVSVFQVPDLNRTVQVGGTGVITLPLVGEVSAGGKTVRELEHEIAGLYEASYLQSPQVSVLVKEYVSQQIVVDGAVNSPGVYQIAGDATLLQAIAQAKGLTRTADPSGIMVFRTINGQRQAAVFDIRPIRQGTAPDPVLAGGDTIVADESGWRASWRNMRESIGVFGFFTALAL
jgi:polysaccharide export outer membrane protein